jgi:mannose/cellobiose epimerase-like protein (N-acyl-D-glucosamine 2-epimerase family)
VQAEALATAARLWRRTGDRVFVDRYDTIAAYAWPVFVHPESGCWYRIRTPDNAHYPEAAPFSGLTDYHTIGAYCDILNAQ